MTEYENIGKILKGTRQGAGMTRAALADAADVPVRTLESREQGRRDFRRASVATVIRIAYALKIERNTFMRMFR